MMHYDVLGDKVPAFVSVPCWVRRGITLYVYSTCEKWCAGLVLCGQRTGSTHVPDEQHQMFERSGHLLQAYRCFRHMITQMTTPFLPS